MSKLTDAITKILNEDSANADTLKPGSKKDGGPLSRGTARLEGEVDEIDNMPVKDTKSDKQDMSKGVKAKVAYPGANPPVGSQPIKKLAEESDEKDEDEDDDSEEKDDDSDDEEVNEEFTFDVDVSEAMTALFDGETFSEEFKTKAATIFESVVVSKIKEYKEVLDEEFVSIVEETTAEITKNLSEQVDDYMETVTENWIRENEVAVESSLRTEMTQDFISGLRNLFIENYIDVPDEQLDVMEDMNSEIDELKDKLNEQIETNINLNKALMETTKEVKINSMVGEMSDVQKDKFKSLAEAVSFDGDITMFSEKLETIKESFFNIKTKPAGTSDENRGVADGDLIIEDVQAVPTGPMAKYVSALSRTVNK